MPSELDAREYPELKPGWQADRGDAAALAKHPQEMPDPQAVEDEPEVEDWTPTPAAKRGDWVQVVFARNNVLPRWQLGRMSFPARLVQYPQGAGDCFRVETVDGIVLDINGNGSEFVTLVHGTTKENEYDEDLHG